MLAVRFYFFLFRNFFPETRKSNAVGPTIVCVVSCFTRLQTLVCLIQIAKNSDAHAGRPLDRAAGGAPIAREATALRERT